MRARQWCLLAVALAIFAISAPAQSADTNQQLSLPLPSAASQLNDLRQRLAESEAQRDELARRLQQSDTDHESVQVERLRKENEALENQLKENRWTLPFAELTEQQRWFVVGGGVALLGLVSGVFASGSRGQRRRWLN